MIGTPSQQPLETSLAIDEGQRAQIVAIQPEQIERDETHGMAPPQHLEKDRTASVVGADDLAIEHSVMDAQPLRQRGRERVEMFEAIAVARNETRTFAVDFEQRAKAVVFQIEEPIGIVEGLGAPLQRERRDSRKSGRHALPCLTLRASRTAR